jgi:transposase-like protein
MSGYDQDNSFIVVAETRRRWSWAEKLAVVAESAGASVSAVARKQPIASSPVFRWRRGLGGGVTMWNPGAGTAFIPVALPAPVVAPVTAAVPGGGVIEIELVSGCRVRLAAPVSQAPKLNFSQFLGRIRMTWAA